MSQKLRQKIRQFMPDNALMDDIAYDDIEVRPVKVLNLATNFVSN